MRQDADRLPALLNQGYRYALALTHDRRAAEDLVQDAWLAVLKADGPWQIGYLRRAIRSRFIDKGRRSHLVPIPAETLPERPVAPRDVVHGRALHQALGALSANEREALYLTVVEGYTAAEVAQMVGKPRGTILSLAHRARARLRGLLGSKREVGNA